jgi:hypothetical protein
MVSVVKPVVQVASICSASGLDTVVRQRASCSAATGVVFHLHYMLILSHKSSKTKKTETIAKDINQKP